MKKKCILIISPVPTHPQTAGNRARILNMANSIKQLGHELYFAHIEREPADDEAMIQCWGKDYFIPLQYTRPRKLNFRIRKKLRSLIDRNAKYTSYIDEWYDDSINDHLMRLHQNVGFDIVIVEYAFFSKALTCFPEEVTKVIDTHDVLTDRHKPYLEKGKKYNWLSTTSGQEKKGLLRANIIIAIQKKEKDYFSHLTGTQTVTIGHTVKTKKPVPNALSKNNILFIGSANQSNIDAITRFCNDMFPLIKQSVPDATVLIAGPVCRKFDVEKDGIIKLGEPVDLDSTYDMADMVINPIQFGTGLKIKNIEALGYSKPLVTTSIGADGMEHGKGTAFLVADDIHGFAESTIKIILNPTFSQSLANNAYDFASQWNQKQLTALSRILS